MPSKNVIVIKKSQDNIPEIFVYGMINEEMANDFAIQLNALAKNAALVNVRINSKGGSVYDGIAMFKCIQNAKCKVDVYVDGIAASMASAFIQAGNKRYASKYARIMAHKPGGGASGNAEDLRRAADEIDDCEAVLSSMYMNKTGKDESQVKALFLNGKDNYFSASEALAAGLIDGIYDGDEISVADDAPINDIYNAVQIRVEAFLNENTTDMKTISMPMAVWAKLCTITAMSESASETEITAAFNKVWDKAAGYDQAKQQLKLKEDEVTAVKAEAVTKEVTAMLEAASGGKTPKITAQQKDIFAKQFAKDPEALKDVLDSMGAFVSITTNLKPADKGELSPEIKAVMAEGWDKLDRAGRLGELKALSEDAFETLYQTKFGYKPNESPLPFTPGNKRK